MPRILSDSQLDDFTRFGFVTLHDCFSREWAKEQTDRAWVRLGLDPDDPSSWPHKRIHMPSLQGFAVREVAPSAYQAAMELIGGEERGQGWGWSDGFIVNLGDGAHHPWQEPSAQTPGWHKDGDFFRHYLDSPEQGLLTLVIWSDIEPRGGGTFVARDSVPVVGKYLQAHPQGVRPNDFPFRDMIAQCHDFIEVTGRVGDVILLHPFILHASSQNHRPTARFLTNPPITLKEPMRLSRPDDSYSPVERGTLRALGVEALDFEMQGERERIVPERVKRQEQVIRDEKARLAAAGAASGAAA